MKKLPHIFPLVTLWLLSKILFSHEQVVGFAFDWDDNIVKMPTSIILFDNKTQTPLPISTDEFAVIRELIGKVGTPWESISLDPCPEKGSLRFFGDLSVEGENHFLKDLHQAISELPSKWQRPAWPNFVMALDHPSTAKNTSIITARKHEPNTVFEGLVFLKDRGLIRFLPPKDNIWTVSSPSFGQQFKDTFGVFAPVGDTQSPSERKVAVAMKLLDQINSSPLGSGAKPVLDSKGDTFTPLHLWGFSDDDFGTFDKMQSNLQNEIDANRWPKVKVSLFYTGLNHPKEEPRAIVLRHQQIPRTFEEDSEWKELFITCSQPIRKLTGHLTK